MLKDHKFLVVLEREYFYLSYSYSRREEKICILPLVFLTAVIVNKCVSYAPTTTSRCCCFYLLFFCVCFCCVFFFFWGGGVHYMTCIHVSKSHSKNHDLRIILF